MNVTGARLYTGRPDSWYIKYSVYFKHEADVDMPVHDTAKAQECTVEKHVIQVFEVCEGLLVWAVSQFVSLSVFVPLTYICVVV
jgi:hypothetical protein